MPMCSDCGLLITRCLCSEEERGRSVQAAYLQQAHPTCPGWSHNSFALRRFCTLWQELKECKQALRLCKSALLSEDSYWERSAALTSVCFLTEKCKERRREIQGWCQIKWHQRHLSLTKFNLGINFYVSPGFSLTPEEETVWWCRKQLLITLIAASAHRFEAQGESARGVVGSAHTEGECLSSPPVSFVLVSRAGNQTRVPRGQSVIWTRR